MPLASFHPGPTLDMSCGCREQFHMSSGLLLTDRIPPGEYTVLLLPGPGACFNATGSLGWKSKEINDRGVTYTEEDPSRWINAQTSTLQRDSFRRVSAHFSEAASEPAELSCPCQ